MKKSRLYQIILLSVVIIALGSCRKNYITDANNYENGTQTVTPSVLLSTVEGSLAYSQGGDLSRFTSLFTQQTLGASRQAEAYYTYVLTSQDADGLWTNLYTSVLMNNDSLIALSERKHYAAYGGVARIMKAYTFQVMVDCWGDLPFSQALQGLTYPKPKYDSASQVYNAILTLCNTAIDSLSSSNPGALIPSDEDFIYNGDLNKWIMFAHAIKARVYMHQSKGNATMAQHALDEIALSFTSNADGAVYPFLGGTETSANPWYQFNQQRTDINFSTSTLLQNMLANGDPRTFVYADTSNAETLGTYYGDMTGTVEFITYEELQFMKAEATLATGGTTVDAETAYQEGITASMTKLGVDAGDMATYIGTYGTLSTSNDTAKTQIVSEAFTALYLNPEAWTLWRRTGIPSLTPIKGTTVPRRFMYPQTEYSYNASNTPTSTLFAPKVFWDK